MEIRTQAFCGIANSKDWQQWLEATAPDLHTSLNSFLKSSSGCRANSIKMQEIYLDLYKRGLGKSFEDLIGRRYPWLVKSKKPVTVEKIEKQQKQAVRRSRKVAPRRKHREPAMDTHGVFASYKPHILSFPQKLILVGDGNYDRLIKMVQQFCADKLAVDYIILDNRAYIEYFSPKYASVVDRYPRHTREIYKYRQKKMQQDA